MDAWEGLVGDPCFDFFWSLTGLFRGERESRALCMRLASDVGTPYLGVVVFESRGWVLEGGGGVGAANDDHNNKEGQTTTERRRKHRRALTSKLKRGNENEIHPSQARKS